MLFGNAFDPVTRIAGIVVRRRNEMANLIGTVGRRSKHLRHQVDDLPNAKLVRHNVIPSHSADRVASTLYGDDRVELRCKSRAIEDRPHAGGIFDVANEAGDFMYFLLAM
jgi:hypothetical protein